MFESIENTIRLCHLERLLYIKKKMITKFTRASDEANQINAVLFQGWFFLGHSDYQAHTESHVHRQHFSCRQAVATHAETLSENNDVDVYVCVCLVVMAFFVKKMIFNCLRLLCSEFFGLCVKRCLHRDRKAIRGNADSHSQHKQQQLWKRWGPVTTLKPIQRFDPGNPVDGNTSTR